MFKSTLLPLLGGLPILFLVGVFEEGTLIANILVASLYSILCIFIGGINNSIRK